MIDFLSTGNISDFRRSIKRDFRDYLEQQSRRVNRRDCLKVDLHCHDYNSDVPDELWGRILGLPETWLKTKKLVQCLHKNDCDLVTVTNHNNARSCWDLLDKGLDILVGAEFTCHFPEYNLFVHVLGYGFTPQQEQELNRLRGDIYQFLRYTSAQDIPVILPHPLYFYTRNDHINLDLFEKFAVMFQRFEVLNGQRDMWQSVLTLNWVRGLTPEKILRYAKKHQLDPADFGVDPFRPKVLTGGSDDHMGIFAGECGSYLHVPDLQDRLKTEKASKLALDAIRKGNIIPFGHVEENQKLNIALLDYFSQVATRIEDPGLLRILFHRGEVSDKLACLTVSNLLLEIQKHKNTQKFFKFVHDALQGRKPGKLIKWKIKKDYKFCVEYLERIADSRNEGPEVYVNTVNNAVLELYTQLNQLIIKRLKKSSLINDENRLECFSTEEITRKFEIPSQLSELLFGSRKRSPTMSGIDIAGLFDQLSFPVLVSTILAGTMVGSTRLLYQNRQFLDDFAEYIGSNEHPRRALYLTDTLKDRNGVSSSLSGKLKEIQQQDMPIDFLICHPDAEPEAHLHVIRPLATFSVGKFGDQQLHIPDLLEISRIFYEGGYDRVICSTEGPMALASLFIKHMFNVPSYFFMHTDWLEFIRNTTDLNQHEVDRIRRVLRFFYKQYAGVFVLNEEHRQWLTGHQMLLDEDQVFLTAHHTAPKDDGIMPISKRELFADADENTPVLLFASRLSREKGVFELPRIVEQVRQAIPGVRLVVAGTGPAQDEMKKLMPDARFLGWVDKKYLARLYAGLDMMLFPSRFDTFGNVILEAFTYGMPVISYNCKGPAHLIEHGVSGFLVDTPEQMAEQIIRFYSPASCHAALRSNAIRRSQDFQAEPIMRQFLVDLGLVPAPISMRRKKAG